MEPFRKNGLFTHSAVNGQVVMFYSFYMYFEWLINGVSFFFFFFEELINGVSAHRKIYYKYEGFFQEKVILAVISLLKTFTC